MKQDPISLRFEKIIERTLEMRVPAIEVVGTDDPLTLALCLSQMTSPLVWNRPQVIVLPTSRDVAQLESDIRFFDPNLRVTSLPGFDVTPYSNLYPNAKILSSRVRWMHEARNPAPRQVFLASLEGMIQRTIPPEILASSTSRFSVNDDLPDGFQQKLQLVGYQAAPVVEDVGQFAIRGGIIDIFSPAHDWPVRIELFGDTIESLRFFNPETQRSEESSDSFVVIPPREILHNDETRILSSSRFRANVAGRNVDTGERDEVLQSLIHGHIFPGIDFLVGDFYEEFALPIDHFRSPIHLWIVSPIEIDRRADEIFRSLREEFQASEEHVIRPPVEDLYKPFDSMPFEQVAHSITFSKIAIQEQPFEQRSPSDPHRDEKIEYSATEIRTHLPDNASTTDPHAELKRRIQQWRSEGQVVWIAGSSSAQTQRVCAILEKADFKIYSARDDEFLWEQWADDQRRDPSLIHIVPRTLSSSLRLSEEGLVFLRDEDFFGQKQRRREYKKSGTLAQRTHTLSFGDLNPGDLIVHELHGIGVYEGLKVMPIAGIASEYIQIAYKDNDKLYLPVYRIAQIQRYSGPSAARTLDKLGGIQWQKTKSKVRNHLREIAGDLLTLYAKRSQSERPPFPFNEQEFHEFEGFFPYDETDDQLKAVNDILGDFSTNRPMDRLVCGDVGFGKTEVAMRAAFRAVQARKQVAVLAPTTVLTFQHLETFRKRFRNWPVVIKAMNRFVSPQDIRETVKELAEGKIDIVIGTHRLLSKDIAFKDLGLLVIDEEQRFGVTHKEKIRKVKTVVDTLTLSATPIPRTLNLSLTGLRDLSIINTPPVDRLPTRTFVCKFDEETIRKAIQAEIHRGGQVYFLHNRVQSIYSVADELRRIVPEARIRVGHGQMDESELEQTMVAFFHHQVDVLVCTTIIESGMDVPRANTMFIDNAHQLGLSQLYQLRGRVGRSKERAYCYLLIPANRRIEKDAQERLKVIQENTALGSGIRIAHHDLELRGSGNILGEDQSGNIDAVGYEMYLELLEEAVRTAKGEPVIEQIEPEINVRTPALIPDTYIPDLRIRLSYYRALAEIQSPEDVDRIEDELRDQFGQLPETVTNLMGLMLIRHHCRELGIRDLSSGAKSISLAFTERTPLPPNKVVELTSLENKKYSITPDNRLIIRMNNIVWPNIYEELLYLKRLCP